MKCSNIFRKTLGITQVGSLFFSCQALNVNAGNFEEIVLKQHITNAAVDLEQIQFLKKLVSANILDGNYSMSEIYSNSSENTERNFRNFLEDLEKILFCCFGALKDLGLEFNEDEYLAACKIDPNLKTRKDFCLKKIKDASNKGFVGEVFSKIKKTFDVVSLKCSGSIGINRRLDSVFDLAGKYLVKSSESIMESIKKENVSYTKVDEVLKRFGIVERKSKVSDFSKVITFLEVFAGKEEHAAFFSFLEDKNFIVDDEYKEQFLKSFLELRDIQKKLEIDINKEKEKKRKAEEEIKERKEREEKIEEIKDNIFKCGMQAWCLNFLADRDIFNKKHSTGIPFNLKTRARDLEEGTFGELIATLNEVCSDALHQYFSCFEENPLGSIKIKDKIDIDKFLDITRKIKMFVYEVFKISSMVLFFSPNIAKDNTERDIATSIIYDLVCKRLWENPGINANTLRSICRYFRDCKSSGDLLTYLEELGEIPSSMRRLRRKKTKSFKSDTERVEYLEKSLQELQSVFFDEIFFKKIDEQKEFFKESFNAFFKLYCKSFSVECWRRLLLMRDFIEKDCLMNYTNTENSGGARVYLGKEEINSILSFTVDKYVEKLLNKDCETRDSNGQIRYVFSQTFLKEVLVNSARNAVEKYCDFKGLEDALEDFEDHTGIKVPELTDSDKGNYEERTVKGKNIEQLKNTISNRDTSVGYTNLLLDIKGYLNARIQERRKLTSSKIFDAFSRMVYSVASRC